MCCQRIRVPMTIKVNPPRISILPLQKVPARQPINTPASDNVKVVIPITNAGLTIATFNKDRLNPTDKASKLVASDNNRSIRMLICEYEWSVFGGERDS